MFPSTKDSVGYVVFVSASNLVCKLDSSKFVSSFQSNRSVLLFIILIINCENCTNYDYKRSVLLGIKS